jgi:hypothetical protein
MARSNDANIFLVKNTWIPRAIKSKTRPWYLKGNFTKAELQTLATPGTVLTFTTKGNEELGKAPRVIDVVSVTDVTPGTKHRVKLASTGKVRVLTIPES